MHGLLMMAADVGFIDTWGRPDPQRKTRTALNSENQKTTHRNVAIAHQRSDLLDTYSCCWGTIDVITQLLDAWTLSTRNHAALKTGIAFMHIGGLVAGGGGHHCRPGD